jgi:hypothetical protein
MAAAPMDPTLKDGRTNSAVIGNLTMIADAARSLRRVRSDEEYDGKGLRTIWHQGKLRSEMLTWENKQGTIVRQELSFFDYVINFYEHKQLNTGRVKREDTTTDVGAPKGNLVLPDAKPVRATLEYASHLLKNVQNRDYYEQHLLKQVNDALNAEFDDDSHTVISSLETYSKEDREGVAKTLVSADATTHLDSKKLRTRTLAFVLLILAGLVLGVGIGLLLW